MADLSKSASPSPATKLAEELFDFVVARYKVPTIGNQRDLEVEELAKRIRESASPSEPRPAKCPACIASSEEEASMACTSTESDCPMESYKVWPTQNAFDGKEKRLIEVADLQAAEPRRDSQAKCSIEFNLDQANHLLSMFGGEDSQITVTFRDGQLIGYHSEYPEEGSIEL